MTEHLYQRNAHTSAEITKAVEELLQLMTIEEKIGQMTQSVGADIVAIGSTKVTKSVNELIKQGKIGKKAMPLPQA